MKLKKIDKVDISLKQLIDVDSSTGITRCVDCIGNGMVLMASVSKNVSVRDSFIFKNLSDIVKGTNGVLTSVTNGILTLSIDPNAISAETSLSELSDVAIAGLADNDYLVYNSVSKKWENSQASFVPTTRTITINGVIQDLSADRTWTISSGSGTVTSVTGTGTVSGLTLTGTVTTSGSLTLGGSLTLTSGNVTTALGFTPYNATNPAGYITSSALTNYVTNSSLTSTLAGYVTSGVFNSTISGLSSVYQPIFTTDNGLTYASGYLKLGGDLSGNTIINGKDGTHSLSFLEMPQLTLQASDLTNTTEINLFTTEIQIKTPLYSSASVGDVLTLQDPATGEAEWQPPTGGGGGGDMYKSTYDADNDGVVDKAETVQITVRNSTGSTLSKGQVVYLSGATGNRPNAILADASTEATSSKTIGIVVADISNNTDGQVAVNGTLHNLNTNSFADGDTLWLSTTPGGYVANTPPAEPNHAVFIGYVARAHPTDGRLVIQIQNGYELTELHGVQVPSPSNNDVLRYNSTSGLWEDDSISTILGYTPGTVTSVSGTGTTAGLSLSGSVTSSGSLTLSGTLSTPVSTINDSTTIGQSLVTLANPSAIRYIRINANNTATAIDAATLRSELGIGNITGSGIITLGSDISLGTGVLNTSFVDITGLSFPITAGRKYSFRGTFIITQSGVATGIRLSINADVAVNVVQFYTQVSLNQNSSTVWYGNAFNSGPPTTAPQNFYSNTIGMMNGYIDANNTGTAVFRFSKWAGNAGTTTVKAGSFVEYTIF